MTPAMPDLRLRLVLTSLLLLASCAPRRPAPPAPPPPAPALPAAPPQQDWRDVPLTPGTWSWSGGAGRASVARFGLAGQAAVFAMRCDVVTRAVVMSRGGAVTDATTMTIRASTPPAFVLAAAAGVGDPPAIVAQASARDPRLDRIAFSRGRFTIDVPEQPQLVLPPWPEIARVIEDCRS